MKNRKASLIISIISLSIICLMFIIRFENKNDNQEISYLTASWNYNYKDINEISNDSDLIAIVRVNKLNNSSEINGIPCSTFEVEVTDPIFGCEVDETFSIFITGVNSNNKKVKIIDDPLLKEGEEFLVFTKK
jgi:hypothetical protein